MTRRHLPERGIRTLLLLSIAGVVGGGLATACAPGGVAVGAGGMGASNIHTGPGMKRVVAKRPPATLLASDGSGCDVSPDRFKGTAVGDLVDCPDWRADPVKR
jgi:hypothetical protein